MVDSKSELLRFVYIKSQVTLHVKSKALKVNNNSTEWLMKNKAANALITFEEIVWWLWLNHKKGPDPSQWVAPNLF